MFTKTVITALTLPLLTLCQYGNGSPGSTTTTAAAASMSSAAGSLPTIQVASNGLTFSPNSVTAAVGSKVVFQFAQPGHTVTQADFNSPCVPSNATGAINSGLSTTGSGPQSFFTVDITSTDPIWFYCAQVSHCQSGMVGVINPPTSGANTLAAFTAAAKNAASSKSIPSTVQGGAFGTPSASGISSSPSASSTSNGASAVNGGLVADGLQLTVFLAFLGLVA